MRPRIRPVLVTALLAGLLGLWGCGGGGGGASEPVATLSLGATQVAFTGDLSDTQPPAPKVVTGSIANAKSTVYLNVVTSGRLLSNATVGLTGGTGGQLTLYPRLASQVGAGTFTDTVTVSASLSPTGSPQIAGSPATIQVTYTITGLTASPATVSLTGVEGASSAPVQVTLANQTGSAAWSAAVTYGSGASGWLSLSTANGNGTSAAISLTGGPLAPGTYQATVAFTAGGKTTQVPVTYTVGTNLGVSATPVAFSAVAGQAQLPAALSVPVTTALPGTTAYAVDIVYGAGASGWLSATGNTAPGTLTLAPNTTSLTPGTSYQATVSLTPTGGGTAVQVSVTYALTASVLGVSPVSSGFAIDGGTAPGSPALTRSVATSDSGASLAWTAATSVPWLSVTASGTSGGAAVLTVLPAGLAPLPNGSYTATVTFSYSGPMGAAGTTVLTVPLLLQLPTVSRVVPYLAYAGESREVVIRGGGFQQGASPQITFGGQAPASLRVVSDTEIRATPPASLPAGEVVVSPGANALGLDRALGRMVVRTAPAYAQASVPAPASTVGRVLYDAERDALLASSPGYIGTGYVYRTAYNPADGTWNTTSAYFPGLFDIAFTPDGRSLLVLEDDHLLFVDPVTLATTDFADLPYPTRVSGTGHQMVVTNSGQVLMPGDARMYSLVTKTFASMNLPSTTAVSDISADGSRAVMGYYPDNPMVYFDASTDTVQWTTQTGYTFPCTLDRLATKVVTGNAVRTPDLVKVGQLSGTPVGFFGTTCLSPDGTRLYMVDSQTSAIRVFDVSGGGPGYTELSPVPMDANGTVQHLLLSPDGKTLFSFGNAILIQPLP